MHRGATEARTGHGWDAVTEMLAGLGRPDASGRYDRGAQLSRKEGTTEHESLLMDGLFSAS